MALNTQASPHNQIRELSTTEIEHVSGGLTLSNGTRIYSLFTPTGLRYATPVIISTLRGVTQTISDAASSVYNALKFW